MKLSSMPVTSREVSLSPGPNTPGATGRAALAGNVHEPKCGPSAHASDRDEADERGVRLTIRGVCSSPGVYTHSGHREGCRVGNDHHQG